jgi:Na+-transporting NADH:ubiquinone oxidoreductase subunit NqrD
VRKSQILIIAVVVLLIGGSVAAYAYDGSQKEEIAQGVTIVCLAALRRVRR